MPPNGTADLARSAVSGPSRRPAPPERTIPRTRFPTISETTSENSPPVCRGQVNQPAADLASPDSGDRPERRSALLAALAGPGDRAAGRSQQQAQADGRDHGREITEGPDPGVGADDPGEDHQQPRADEEGRPGRKRADRE